MASTMTSTPSAGAAILTSKCMRCSAISIFLFLVGCLTSLKFASQGVAAPGDVTLMRGTAFSNWLNTESERSVREGREPTVAAAALLDRLRSEQAVDTAAACSVADAWLSIEGRVASDKLTGQKFEKTFRFFAEILAAASMRDDIRAEILIRRAALSNLAGQSKSSIGDWKEAINVTNECDLRLRRNRVRAAMGLADALFSDQPREAAAKYADVVLLTQDWWQISSKHLAEEFREQHCRAVRNAIAAAPKDVAILKRVSGHVSVGELSVDVANAIDAAKRSH